MIAWKDHQGQETNGSEGNFFSIHSPNIIKYLLFTIVRCFSKMILFNPLTKPYKWRTQTRRRDRNWNQVTQPVNGRAVSQSDQTKPGLFSSITLCVDYCLHLKVFVYSPYSFLESKLLEGRSCITLLDPSLDPYFRDSSVGIRALPVLFISHLVQPAKNLFLSLQPGLWSPFLHSLMPFPQNHFPCSSQSDLL